MQTMLERVAAAEAQVDGYSDLMAMPRTMRERYIQRAQAAVEAMREPTDGMVEAGSEALLSGSAWGRTRYPSDAWKAMIDAALAEGAT